MKKVYCQICNKKFKKLTAEHIYSHGINKKDYITKYGSLNYTKNYTNYKNINWFNISLGLKPDSLIADQTGVERRTVCGIRNKLNINPFIGIILSQEDQPLRSILEAKYDAYLHWKCIPHDHEVPVPNTKYIADFKLIEEEEFIEIAGMLPRLNQQINSYLKKYQEKHHRKIKIYNSLNLT